MDKKIYPQNIQTTCWATFPFAKYKCKLIILPINLGSISLRMIVKATRWKLSILYHIKGSSFSHLFRIQAISNKMLVNIFHMKCIFCQNTGKKITQIKGLWMTAHCLRHTGQIRFLMNRWFHSKIFLIRTLTFMKLGS